MGRPKLSDAEKAARAAARAPTIKALNDQALNNPGSILNASGEVMRKSSGGAKVTVACKIGIAYFNLQLFQPVEVSENTQTGPRKIIEHRRVGPVVQLRGTAYPRGTVPEGFPDRPEMVGGAALNRGIDKDFFDEWMRQNQRGAVVKNNLIFGDEDHSKVVAMALELAGEASSGLEPINPKKDSRMPRPTNSALSPIEKRTD
jgi:hypothetical protein